MMGPIAIILIVIGLWIGSIVLMCYLNLSRQAKKDAKDIELLIQKDRWRQDENR